MPAVPAVVLILASFALILLLMRFKVPLYLGVFAAVLFLTPFISRGLPLAGVQFWDTLKDPDVISLLIIILLILLLSTVLRLGGRLERMTEAFSAVAHSRRMRLAMFPALIGLLPMPGGAWFSAPMVKASARDIEEHHGQLTAINYWFRHIWEYWWPLYPGVLLLITFTGLSLPRVIALMAPMTIIVVLIGLLTVFRDLKVSNNNQQAPSGATRRDWLILLSSLWPILAVVIGGVALELARESYEAAGHSIYQPLPRSIIIAALLVVSIATIFADHLDLSTLRSEYGDRKQLEITAMIFAVIYYKNVLEQGGLVERSVRELQAWHVPVWFVIVFLPILIGVVTGVVVAAVGVSFPVILGLASGAGIGLSQAVIVAYTAAMVGVMFSPIHFCLLLSLQYFGDTFWPVYRRITIPLLMVMGFSFLLAWLHSLL
jgi:integral membrane protein (TIGR00529 family)